MPQEIKYEIISVRKTIQWVTPVETREVYDVFFEAPPYAPTSVYIPVEEYTPERVKEEIAKKIKELMAAGPPVGEVVIE